MSTATERKAIADALAAIAERNNGVLTPDAVVAEAKEETSVLHGIFEWDNDKASNAWRVAQARALIRSVRVDIRTEKSVISTVGYIRDPYQEHDEQGYRSVVKLTTEKDVARSALLLEFERAASMLRRAQELAEVFGLQNEFEAIATSLTELRTRVEGHVVEKAQTRQ